MEYLNDRTWLEIDLDAIKRNYLNIRSKLTGNCQIVPVLKANAYGLGAVHIARLFEELHCPLSAVATIEEAMNLREHDISMPVLILGPINPVHASVAAENCFHVSIVSARQGEMLSKAAARTGRPLLGHIKIDSGLSRLGIVIRDRKAESLDEIRDILSLPGIDVRGVFTHTSNFSGNGRNELEKLELELFADVVSSIRRMKPEIKIHCLSSSTLQFFPEYSFDYVRVGVLYMGTKPDPSGFFEITQAVSLKTRIWQKKSLGQGASVSYDATYITSRPTTVAIVPIGYADGLRRSLSNRGHMLLHGKKAPIIGKICCDYTILDVTDIPEAEEGDLVTIFGTEGGMEQYPYHYAELYPASVSEVTATLTSRIPRFYRKNGIVSDRD